MMIREMPEWWMFPERRIQKEPLWPEEEGRITVECLCKTAGKTGVEMEALTGVSVTLLTIYDMCKAIDKRMHMEGIHLVEKQGGKSGAFYYEEEKK